ncbi:MAG: YtxH domain-containing protein [Actinobacteria bacterium]|nr:YtxH domain-containing protein [Actinomycetota bacterium]
MRSHRLDYFLIGVFVGGLLGVVAGLLFAPDSGIRTRQKIATEANKVADAARQAAERAESVAEALGAKMDHYLGRDEEMAWRKVQEIREGVQRYSRTVMSS